MVVLSPLPSSTIWIAWVSFFFTGSDVYELCGFIVHNINKQKEENHDNNKDQKNEPVEVKSLLEL